MHVCFKNRPFYLSRVAVLSMNVLLQEHHAAHAHNCTHSHLEAAQYKHRLIC